MNIGAMNKLCIIEKFTTTYDEYNYETQEWAEVARLYGDFQPFSSKDLISAKAAGTEITARLVTHFIDGMDSTMRVVIHGLTSEPVTYSVNGSPQPDLKSNREFLTWNLVKV